MAPRHCYAARALCHLPSVCACLALDTTTATLWAGCRDGSLLQFSLDGEDGGEGKAGVQARLAGRAQVGRRPVTGIALLPAARRVAVLCDGNVSLHPARLWDSGDDDMAEAVPIPLPAQAHLIRADGDVPSVPFGSEPCYPPRLLVAMKKKLAVIEVKTPAKAHVLCELDIPTSARDAVWLDRQRVLLGTKRSYSVLDVGAVLRGLAGAPANNGAAPTLAINFPCDGPNGLSAFTAAGFLMSRSDPTPVPLLVDVVELQEGTFVPLCSKIPALGNDGAAAAAAAATAATDAGERADEVHALFVCTMAGVVYDAIRLRPSSVGALAFPTAPQRIACATRGAPYVLSLGGDGVVHVLDLSTGSRVQSMVLEDYPDAAPRSLVRRLSATSDNRSESAERLKAEVHLAASSTIGPSNSAWAGAVAVTCETAVSLYVPVAPATVVGELLRDGRLDEALEAAASESRALANAHASTRNAAAALLDATRAEAGFLYLAKGKYEAGFRSLARASGVRPGEVFPFVPAESRRFGALAKPQRRLGVCPPPEPLDKLAAATAAEARRFAASPVNAGAAPTESALLHDARGWLAWFLLECRRRSDLSEEEREAVDTVAARVLADLSQAKGNGATVHRSRLEVLCADPSNRVNLLDAGSALTACGCHVALAVLHESHGVFAEALRLWRELHVGSRSESGGAAEDSEYARRACRAAADAACPADVAQDAVTSWLLPVSPGLAVRALAARRVGGAVAVDGAVAMLEPHGEHFVAAYLGLVVGGGSDAPAAAAEAAASPASSDPAPAGAAAACAAPATRDAERFVLACTRLAWPSPHALGGHAADAPAAAAERLLGDGDAREDVQLAWSSRLLNFLQRTGEYKNAPSPDAARASATISERMRKWSPAGSADADALEDAWRRCMSAARHLEGRTADAARELLHLHGAAAPGAGGVSLTALAAAEAYAAGLGSGPGAERALLALFDELLRRGGHSAAARLAASGLGGCDPVRVLHAAPGLAPLTALPAIAEPLFRAAEAARRRGALRKSLARAASTRRRGELAVARGGRVVLCEGTCCACCHKLLGASSVFGVRPDDGVGVVCWTCLQGAGAAR